MKSIQNRIAMNWIETQDPDVWRAIAAEEVRQQDGLEMIASENYVSPAIMQAAGSVLTNKYAEGYPGRRYYGGCEHVDVIEDLARDRAKKLFGAEHANVQPHAGSQANLAVYLSAVSPGDTVLGFDLAHGGHLTHGMKLNISGRLYNFVAYGVDRATGRLDFDQVAQLAKQHRPKLIVAGASAYPREIPHGRFAEIAADVGARLFVDMAHYAGLVAAGLHDNPVPVADFVTTTTHKTLRGPRAGLAMCKSDHARELDRSVFPGSQGGPLVHIIAAKAICFAEALEPDFKAYAARIIENAQVLGEALHSGGLSLATGGTDNHLLLADVTAFKIGGHQAEQTLSQCGITVNKNLIPFDERKPMDPSGIRIGTPALTTRGMGPEEMRAIGAWMLSALRAPDDQAQAARIRGDVKEMCQAFPVPAEQLPSP